MPELRFRDVLSADDRAHLKRILSGRGDPMEGETKRRDRVRSHVEQDTYMEEASIGAFKALAQDDREKTISDLIWRLTCIVEGSITKSGRTGRFSLGGGFRLVETKVEGREHFCVVWRGKVK